MCTPEGLRIGDLWAKPPGVEYGKSGVDSGEIKHKCESGSDWVSIVCRLQRLYGGVHDKGGHVTSRMISKTHGSIGSFRTSKPFRTTSCTRFTSALRESHVPIVRKVSRREYSAASHGRRVYSSRNWCICHTLRTTSLSRGAPMTVATTAWARTT